MDYGKYKFEQLKKQKEAKKNDVIALGCLLIQFGIHPYNSDFSSYLVNNLEHNLRLY